MENKGIEATEISFTINKLEILLILCRGYWRAHAWKL